MQTLTIDQSMLLPGTTIRKKLNDGARLGLPAGGGGLVLDAVRTCRERWLTFFVHSATDHSQAMQLEVLSRHAAAPDPVFTVRFGIMPDLEAKIAIDLRWLDGHLLFPEHQPGQLKFVCHGRRVHQDEICQVRLTTYPSHHDFDLTIRQLTLTDQEPQTFPVADVKLIDPLGQYKRKDWPGKVTSIDDLRLRLEGVLSDVPDAYPLSRWSRYGGDTSQPLQTGAGFFRTCRREGRWWLADPDGNAFFSMGPDCTTIRPDGRVDGVKAWLDWLPDRDDPDYEPMYQTEPPRRLEESKRDCLLFSYTQANLFRVFGPDWYQQWTRLISRQLKHHGLNTLGNWSDPTLGPVIEMPYVTQLSRFPSTPTLIFRDFPDVFSPDFAADAQACAAELEARRGDPWLIGYFLRNEPAWAFVDRLIIADEVLRQPQPTASRQRLIDWLRGRYHHIEALNAAWKTDWPDFSPLEKPIEQASALSEGAMADMREFSRQMLEAYVGIPSQACRRADPDHLNLGMRWAWISDPDVVTGWQHFDVFSINCYAMDPTDAIDQVDRLGVDRPVMIGEFHFGALDRGLTATGLEAVRTQSDRGRAYQHYCERVAAHPQGIGCHYFQCYDQFALGRFDGENYNIGLLDITSQPYADMMEAVRRCADRIYDVAAGRIQPTEDQPESLPMIAY